MLELPEAVTLTRQMNDVLAGKVIASAKANTSPHKFAFYHGNPVGYAAKFAGQTLGRSRVHGSLIVTKIGTGHELLLGDGGLRVLFHESERTLPKKHQLLLRFTDDTALTVSVSGWGAVWLMTPEERSAHRWAGRDGVAPNTDAFTREFLEQQIATLPEGDKRSIKYFVISDPKVFGVANGYLQDILFHARLHPRRRAAALATDERTLLYGAIRSTIADAIAAGGRITERDLFNQRGRYTPRMYTKTKELPCTICGTPIKKISYLGGSCYLCPTCQPLPEE